MKLLAKDIAAALLLILLFLIAFAKEERDRLLDWFKYQSGIKRYFTAILVTLFLAGALTFLFGPSLWEAANMIFNLLNC